MAARSIPFAAPETTVRRAFANQLVVNVVRTNDSEPTGFQQSRVAGSVENRRGIILEARL